MHAPALDRLRSCLQDRVDQGLLPGAVALVHHRGRTVLHEAVGALRPGPDAPPMPREALFRIYSMTKPIASLVALMLVEEGRLLLAHPVSRYLGAFAGQQLLDAASGEHRPAPREATVYDLLRHTAGLSYGWGEGPVDAAYRAARIGSRRRSNANLAAALGPLPLAQPPGSAWEYSYATDVLGAVIEQVEGAPLADVLRRRVFEPLAMADTGFAAPPHRLADVAEPFATDPQTGTAAPPLADVSAAPVFESAGGGLVSTAADYARFLQLMLGGGTLARPDGTALRLASRATIAFMTADHIGSLPRVGDILPQGYGFGLGVAVRLAAGGATRAGSAGSYGWSGMAGTFFVVDPAEELFALVLTQAPGQLGELCELFPALVYAAL